MGRFAGNRELSRRLARLTNPAGVPVYLGARWGAGVFRLEFDAARGRVRGVIREAKHGPNADVLELWEGQSLAVLRRIATGYYPQLSRILPSARVCKRLQRMGVA